jgi:hypothetical protein
MKISDSFQIRVMRPVKRDGHRRVITILKSSTGESVEERTIKRTIDGEKACLQIKWVTGSDGINEPVHIDCEKHKPSTEFEWRRGLGIPVERFYEVSENSGIWLIKCKTCGRKWDSSGSPNPANCVTK